MARGHRHGGWPTVCAVAAASACGDLAPSALEQHRPLEIKKIKCVYHNVRFFVIEAPLFLLASGLFFFFQQQLLFVLASSADNVL
jgi:hypothetical protein